MLPVVNMPCLIEYTELLQEVWHAKIDLTSSWEMPKQFAAMAGQHSRSNAFLDV